MHLPNERGHFLGYKVNADGLKVCPNKVETVLSLPSTKCLKDVQKLNGKLASLNRFQSKSAEKPPPFFKTLKKCTKKSDFQWTTEAETAFKQMKKSIAELPMLTAPKEKEELIIYLATAKEAVGAVLMTKRNDKQMAIYFVSRALQGTEINYTPMEKLVLALVSASKRLKRYFQAHTIIFIKDQPIKQILLNPEVTRRLLKWSKQVVLEELKEKFINEMEVLAVVEEEGNTWITPVYKYLVEDILPEDKKKARAIRRKVGRYAVTNGILYKKSFLGPWLHCVGPLQANYVLREIHEGSCNMHAGPRPVVAKVLRSGYYWPTMHTDARDLIRKCSSCQGIDIAKPFMEGPEKVKFLIVATDYFTKWITAKLVATITGAQTSWKRKGRRQQFSKQKAKPRWKNTITTGSAAQASIQATLSTETMKQAMRQMEASSDQNGRDHMELRKPWEMEPTSLETTTEIPSREHGTSATSRNVICTKCKHLSHARQRNEEGTARISFIVMS
nr:reverse transcriptase domain-containing protein [Tanacetum cinerariifolium]